MVTLTDVAKRANVSKMTVSRVINHPEQVTDELKELVFQAMKELNYKPNVAAKALAHNRTQVIKLFILEEMDTTEPYYMNLLMGISKELDNHQYSLQLVSENSFDIGQCDGYIITGMRDKDYDWINGIEKPVILFGENRYGYDFVDTNNQQGTIWRRNMRLRVDTNISFLSELMLWSLLSFLEKQAILMRCKRRICFLKF